MAPAGPRWLRGRVSAAGDFFCILYNKSLAIFSGQCTLVFVTTTERKRHNSPHQPVGRWIRPDKRLAIYLRDDFRCLICLRRLNDADASDVTLDHIVPRVDGGSNHESNLYTCCRSCNCARQDTPLTRFASKEARAHIRRNVRRSLKRYRALAKAIIAGTEAGVIK